MSTALAVASSYELEYFPGAQFYCSDTLADGK